MRRVEPKPYTCIPIIHSPNTPFPPCTAAAPAAPTGTRCCTCCCCCICVCWGCMVVSRIQHKHQSSKYTPPPTATTDHTLSPPVILAVERSNIGVPQGLQDWPCVWFGFRPRMYGFHQAFLSFPPPTRITPMHPPIPITPPNPIDVPGIFKSYDDKLRYRLLYLT